MSRVYPSLSLQCSFLFFKMETEVEAAVSKAQQPGRRRACASARVLVLVWCEENTAIQVNH